MAGTDLPADNLNPQGAALLTLAEAAVLSGQPLSAALWTALEHADIPAAELLPYALRDLQAGSPALLDLVGNDRAACPKLRRCLRHLVARHSFPGRDGPICRMAVLQQHGRARIARPDLTLVRELLQGCLQHGKVLVGPLGGLFDRRSWNYVTAEVAQHCLDLVESHLQRAVAQVILPGTHPDNYRITAARALFDVAVTLTPTVMPAFWPLVFRLPAYTSQLLIQQLLPENRAAHWTLIESLNTYQQKTGQRTR